MKLMYALLASGAEFTPDGRLWVLGGDIDMFYTQDTPAILPTLTLALKLLVLPRECGIEHQLRIRLTNANNVSIRPDTSLAFTPYIRPEYPHRAIGVGLSFAFQQVQFEHLGEYTFHILIDSVELGTLSLTITPTALPAPRLAVRPTNHE